MKHSIIRHLALVLALAMLLSAVGFAESLSLNGLELPETELDGLSLEDVFIDDATALELPDFGDEIELPDSSGEADEAPEAAVGEAGEEPGAADGAPEILEDMDGVVEEAAAAVESEPAQDDMILIDEEIEQTGGAGDGWQVHGDVPGAEADNDALADAYLRRVLPGFGKGGRTYASPGAGRKRLAKQSLTGSLTIYDALKPMIEAVAAGKRTSTEFTFDSAALGTADHWWTPEDLGVASFDDEGFGDALLRKEGIDDSALVYALLEDCPYHLYWFDKTQGWGMGYIPASDGSRVRLDSLTLSLAVAEAYAAGTYTVNARPAYVSQAVSNINGIISNNAAKGDLDKVTAYADVICNYVEYNHPAADNDSTPYGDPWQLVWIFDGYPDTKVVCEGYAKGFKYLCDLSTFQGSVGCILAEGMLSGGTGEGAHMWNSLKMDDGRCYLVDLTNCDAGDTCSYTLFLKGATGEAGGPYVCAGLRYEFYDWIKNEYGADSPWLTYSSADYGKEEAGGGDGSVNADWAALQAEINSAANNGKVTLTKDITASDGNIGLEIPADKALTLDLAGHTLDRSLKAAKNDGYVLGVSGSLTLVDSVGGGKITGGWTTQYGGGIYVDYGASLTVAGGEISGNQAFDGGGVGAPNGTVVISGGRIAKNISTAQGGGVKLESGKIVMTGGVITGNRSSLGGGIWLSGTFEMNGGKITDNDAYDGKDPETECHNHCGGGICAYQADITVSGGEISGNRCNVNAGNGTVFHYADGASPWCKGGGLYIHYGTLRMTGGTIRDNTAVLGGGVVVEDADLMMTGGDIKGNTGDIGSGIYLHACQDTDTATFTMKGGIISGNVSGDPTRGAVYLHGSNGNAVLNLEQGQIVNNVGCGVFGDFGDMRMTGGEISGNTSVGVGGVSMHYCNTFDMAGGRICDNTGTGILIDAGVFTLSGGTIEGNDASNVAYSDCGGILLNGCGERKVVFNMTGGSIKNNSGKTGGGIYAVGKLCEIHISGGEITGNTATEYGGGIYLYDNSHSGNPLGDVYFSGSPKITGNQSGTGSDMVDSNCYIYGDVRIITAGGLDQTARIGMTDGSTWMHGDSYVFTSGLGTKGNIGAFFSDDPGYTIEWTEDGKEACLVKKEIPTDPTTPTDEPTAEPPASSKIDLSNCKLAVKDQTYTGKALKPAVTVKYGSKALKQDTDYTVSYKNNVKPGTATVTVTGKGDYTGSAEATFRILVPLSKCKLTVKDQTYTGKALKPAVTVKYGGKALKKGADYTVSYKANKAVGVATATVKGKGNYTGTKKVTFKILPRTVAISKLTAGKQKLTVKWGKRAEATGYALQYAMKSSFAGAKTVKIKKNSTVSATIKKLKAGKTYYVRLRTYKTVGKKTYYSAWSKGKGVKVK